MTSLLDRLPRTDPTDDLRVGTRSGMAQSAALRGVVAASWTAALGAITVTTVSVIGWFAGSSGTFPDALRVGGLAWLVSNGSGLQLPSASITLLPLGALALNGWALHRSGQWVGSHLQDGRWRDLVVGAGVLAVTYGALAVTVAVATSTSAATAGVVRPLVAGLLLPVVCGGSGLLRGAGKLSQISTTLPVEAQAAVTGGTGGLLALLAASAAVLAASLLLHFSTAVTLAEQLHAGLVGGAIFTVITLAFVPNAVICAGAFVSGPGFSLGSANGINPGSPATGNVPGFPLLAAVPVTATPLWLEGAMLLIPLLAGALAGLLAVRRFPVSSLQGAGVRGGLAGLVCGGAFGVLAVLSTGGVGPGRMAMIGPRPEVVLTTGLVCLLGGAAAAAAACAWQSRRERRKSTG